MIDAWKRERAELDNQIAFVQGHIDRHPNRQIYQGPRVKLRILVNQLCVTRAAVHQKILKYEDEERLTEIFKDISGLSESEAASLMRAMDRLKTLNV